MERAVVTGLGVLASNGVGKEQFWRSLCNGESGTRRITRFDPNGFPTFVAGEVQDFHPENFIEDKALLKRLDRFSQFSIASVRMALDDASLPLEEIRKSRVAIVLGTAIGGTPFAEEQLDIFKEQGLHAVSPMLAARFFPGSNVNAVCIALQIFGYAMTISTGCTSGTDAIGHGLRMLQTGKFDYVIVGGVEAPLAPLTFGSFLRIGVMSTEKDEPLKSPRPFDKTRSGIVLSEGAGALILETETHVRNRKAKAYAAISGYATSHDAYHLAQSRPDGTQALIAMREAISDAGLEPIDIDYVNAHGSATQLSDPIETSIYKKLFGKRAHDIPVSSSEGAIGHVLGAGGAIKGVACALALQDQVIPPTAHYKTYDPSCDLDYVPNKFRKGKFEAVMSVAFSFGGKNSILIFQAPQNGT